MTAAMSQAYRHVRIAVLDTGIYTNHPDLQGCVVYSKNCVKEAQYVGKFLINFYDFLNFNIQTSLFNELKHPPS